MIGALNDSGLGLNDGDIVVLAQKIVSKVEDCYTEVATSRHPGAHVDQARHARAPYFLLRKIYFYEFVPFRQAICQRSPTDA